jgi:hypothetical protein
VRSAAALALVVITLVGCTRERPSPYSVRSCLEQELPRFQISEVPIDQSYTGEVDDLTGVRGLGAVDFRRGHFYDAAVVVFARSDPDARRIQRSRLGRMYFGSNRRGSVLYSDFGSTHDLRQRIERCL